MKSTKSDWEKGEWLWVRLRDKSDQLVEKVFFRAKCSAIKEILFSELQGFLVLRLR